AEKLSCRIGAHPVLAILLCCELSVGSSPVPGSDSAYQPISGELHEPPQTRDRPYGGRAIRAGADKRSAWCDAATPTHRRDPTRACKFSPRSQADSAPHRMTLGVSKPLLRRICLTPGAWALCGGRPL